MQLSLHQIDLKCVLHPVSTRQISLKWVDCQNSLAGSARLQELKIRIRIMSIFLGLELISLALLSIWAASIRAKPFERGPNASQTSKKLLLLPICTLPQRPKALTPLSTPSSRRKDKRRTSVPFPLCPLPMPTTQIHLTPLQVCT